MVKSDSVSGLVIALAVTGALAAFAQSEPASFEANHRQAEFYASKGKLSDAIPFFEKARRLDPANYANGYDLALAYSGTGAFDKARTQIGDMLARGDRAELHNLLGLVEEKAGNVQIAADQYQQAAHMDPTEKHVFDLAECFLKYHGTSEALQIFAWGVEKCPKSARMRVGQGVAFYSTGEYDKAVEALCAGVDLDPRDPRPLYFLGKMYDVSLQLADEVTKRLAHFVEVYPENASANYYYALSLWKRNVGANGGDSRVEKHLKKAIALDNALAAAHFQLGILYSDKGKQSGALREFEQAARFDPESDKYHYRLGQAYRAAGQEEKAREQFRLYRDLHR
jgi:tetratricopeptide (TPR) repeat protein